MANGLPRDPMLLLSVVNTKLRDYYHSLDALCDDMNVNKEEAVVFTFCERLIMNNTKEQRECLIL